jgi:hypothetical protein
MSYFVTPQASSNQIAGAINYILANLGTNYTSNQGSGIVNTSTTATSATSPTGATTGYLYRYLDVAFADNYAGNVNFSSTPLSTSKYYGLRNTNSSVYDTNPTDYVWFQVAGGFTGGNLLWYQTFGGLQINFVVATSAPTPAYQVVPNAVAIDLTIVSTATNLQARSAYAVSSVTLGNTPSTYTTTGNSTFPPNNTWGGSETWVANPPSYTASQNVYQIDGIYNPSTNLTLWVAPYLATLKVGSLSAINANLGTITAGTLNAVTVNSSTINAGTTPPVIDSTNHTISSGAGGLINPNGTFAFGTTTQNIVDDGTGVYLNGLVTAKAQVINQFILSSTSDAIIIPSSKFVIPKNGSTIVTCSGNYLYYATTTSTRPSAVSGSFIFRVLNSSSALVFEYDVIVTGSTPNYNSTTPFLNILEAPFSFSILLENLPSGSYSLVCLGSNAYAGLTYFDYAGNYITSGITTTLYLNTTSYFYQVG